MKKIYIVLAVVLLVLAASCKKEDENLTLVNKSFESVLEKPEAEGEQAKNYLAMERYVYWEPSDVVAVLAGANCPDDDQHVKDLGVSVRSNPRYASINCNGIAYSDEYYGIFPAESRVGTNPEKINLIEKYIYRDDEHADFSFPRPGIPMVAWDGGEGTDPESAQLDFHSVCGLVRVQITSTEEKTITEVAFTEGGSHFDGYAVKPITGEFDVHGIKTYTPYLSTSRTDKDTRVIYQEINKLCGPSNLLTFYLPLPAIQATGNPMDEYVIGLSVKNTDGQIFKKVFKVKIRRNTMSFLPAIEIKEWEKSTTNRGLVGCGTELRPYQIYDSTDMRVVRDAFRSGSPMINGQPVTQNTVFRVVRSDIRLTNEDQDGNPHWNEGIHDFVGKFTFQTANDRIGIENLSNAPIFEEITENGTVEGFAVKGDNRSNSADHDFSPFCRENHGTLNNCSNLSTITSSTGFKLAGLCVENFGVITNCVNLGALTTTDNAAGICLTNHEGGIIECYAVSSSRVTGNEAAGICHTNEGIVRNTQVTYSRSDINNPYGGIVYVNSPGGRIESCQVLGTLVSRSEIGGICHTNQGYVITCRNGLSLLQGNGRTGGIVAYQSTIGDPEIRNCFNSSASAANVRGTSGVVGGIIAYLNGGRVYNCFSSVEVASSDARHYGSIAGQIQAGSVQNCYNGSTLSQFYGTSIGSPIGKNCFNPTPLDYCSVYDRSTGLVTTPRNDYCDVAQNGHMYTALNTWVGSHGNDYLSWTEATLPIFTAK